MKSMLDAAGFVDLYECSLLDKAQFFAFTIEMLDAREIEYEAECDGQKRYRRR